MPKRTFIQIINMTKYIFLFVIAISFMSCERETYYDYAVANNSSTTITLNGSDIIHSTTIDESIEAGNTKTISTWSKLGKTTDVLVPTSMFGDDLIIVNANGDVLQKDYKLTENWETTVDDKRATADHKYILTITDVDFEQ